MNVDPILEAVATAASWLIVSEVELYCGDEIIVMNVWLTV